METLRTYSRYRTATRREPAAWVLLRSANELAAEACQLARRLGGRLWLVADTNTLAAAPELADRLDISMGTVFRGSPTLVPAREHAEQIAREAADAGAAAMLVVGGGTLTDLAKYAAREVDIPLVSIPSAASVDAYTSAKSALRIDGYHRTPVARVPDVVIACPEIVEAAPDRLGYAGIGDLIAKLVARIDWQLGALMTGEAYSERESAWSAQAARAAIARFRRGGLRTSAVPALDALLVTGRAMVLAGSSRPAASAEHTFAHLWEVALPDEPGLHGALVATATRLVAPAYAWILNHLEQGVGPATHAEERAREAIEEEQSWEERVPDDMQPYLGKLREESAGRGLTREIVLERLQRTMANRAEIVRTSRVLLDEVERALEALEESAGEAAFPVIPDHWKARAFTWVRYLRNRYSLFDLAWELGWEPELLAHVGA